jgi:hypothetical protein
MSLQNLEDFVKSAAPGFRCYAAGHEAGPRFVARVRHVLNAPASSKSIAQLRRMLKSEADAIADFYRHHDGFVLYQDTESEAAGVELLPIEQWEEATDDMQNWFDHLEPDDDPDHILTGIAIAAVPQSGNYFVMPIEGASAGKVFYADHDGWYESAFADDFAGFLLHVMREPVALLNEELGCYTRYSDGRTDAQWIPEEYFSDVSKLTT